MQDGAARDSREDPLAVEERMRARHRVVVRDEQLPVELPDVEDRRHVAVVERAQPHHRIARQRLGGGDDDVGKALSQSRAGTHQRPTGAEAGDEDVDAVERVRDLGPGAPVVGARIRLVGVLERHEIPRLSLGELERDADCAVRPLLAGRLDHRRAVEAQELPALIGGVLREDAGERVALELRDEGERDAGVA